MAENPDLYRTFRRCFNEIEGRATVELRGIACGAELQRIGGRVNALRADTACEQQRYVRAFAFRDHRGVGRRQARIHHQDDIVLGDQLLCVGGCLRGLRPVIFDQQLDLFSIDAAGRVDAIDIDAQGIDRGCVGA